MKNPVDQQVLEVIPDRHPPVQKEFEELISKEKLTNLKPELIGKDLEVVVDDNHDSGYV